MDLCDLWALWAPHALQKYDGQRAKVTYVTFERF